MGDVVMEGPRRLADSKRDGTLFVLDLTEAPRTESLPDVTMRAAGAADAAALRDAMDATGTYAGDEVQTRLSSGRLPYVVEKDGLVASYGWVALSAEPIGDLGIAFQLEPGEAYIYDCATRPAYRGRGFYPALLRYIARDLGRAGLRRAWIGTAPGNATSQRGIVRAGFTKVADVNVEREPNGHVDVELYGVPGIAPELLRHAAWSFHGRPYADAGISVVSSQ